jgi:hypothetical protein
MLYPQGKAIIENLKTSFINIDGVLRELEKDNFTGYIRVCLDNYEGALIYENGKLMESIEEYQDGKPKVLGKEAVVNIIKKVKQGTGGFVTVQELSPQVIKMMLRTIHSSILYKDLLSEFTQIKNLLVTLKTKAITGHVEIQMNEGHGQAFIFLEEGRLIESLFSGEDGVTLSGKKGLAKILEVANEVGYVMNVYQVTESGKVKKSTPAKPILTPMKEVEEEKEVEPVEEVEAELEPVSEAEEEELETSEAFSTTDITEVLEVIQKIVLGIEQSLDRLFGKGQFFRVFLQTLSQKSEDYPFLKSLHDNLLANKNNFTIEDATTPDEMVLGISDVLDQCISYLQTPQHPRAEIVSYAQKGLASVRMVDEELIQKYGLDRALFELLG